MSKMVGFLAGLALAVGLGACTSPSAGAPCERCTYKMQSVKTQPAKWVCAVDGKEVDCRANPGACPGCKP